MDRGGEIWDGPIGGHYIEQIPFEEAIREGERRILFTGPRRSGKSSIERVIFHKMSPHETLFLESTHGVEIHQIANNDFLRFQTWDFGEDLNPKAPVYYMGNMIPIERVLRNCSTLVYVIDAQENDFDDSLPKLTETIIAAYTANPNIHFEVFLHKVDGEVMPDESKAEKQQLIQNFVASELSDVNADILVSYYLTSIYDHSALEAFSKVVQKLVPQLPVLNSLLDKLIESSIVDKSYLLDVFTKLYIATDSNPVDSRTYELCADLVELVIDVSCIYGLSEEDGAAIPYDQQSSSAIRLNNNIVLYLREVSKYVALVCVIREESFAKRAVLDFNINCFRKSLDLVIRQSSQHGNHHGGSNSLSPGSS
jgi:Ras-related GTP-binding protein C/D